MNKKFLIILLLILAILVAASIGYFFFVAKKAPDGAMTADKTQTGDVPADGSDGSVDLVRPPFLDE